VRKRLREEEAAVQERQVRRHDHILRPQGAAIGLHPARIPLVDVERTCLLEHVAALAGDRPGEREQVLARVELRLIAEPDRPGDLVR
jgi:hypothetical protein